MIEEGGKTERREADRKLFKGSCGLFSRDLRGVKTKDWQ